MRGLATLAALFATVCEAQTAPPVSPQAPPVLRVAASIDDPYARGAQLGRETKALFPDIEQRYDGILADLPKNSLDIPSLRASLTPDQRSEVQGLADAFDLVSTTIAGDGALSLQEFWRVQFLGESAEMAGGVALGQDIGDKGAVLAHALHGDLAKALSPLSAVTVIENQDGGIALVGFAGMLSAPAGFNHEGLALALIDGPAGTAPPASPSRSAFHALRIALERESDVEAVARRFALSDFGRGLSVLIADTNVIRVLETPRSGAAVLRGAEDATRQEMTWDLPDAVAATSCFAGVGASGGCRNVGDMVRWASLRDAAINVMASGPDTTLATFSDQFAQSPAVDLGARLWAFAPSSRDLYVGAAGTKASLRRVGNLLTPTKEAWADQRRRTAWLAAWLAMAAALAAFARFAPGGRRFRSRIRSRHTSGEAELS